MSVELLERAAAALGDLTEEVVFVGGARRKAFPHAAPVELPSGAPIKAVFPPFLLATKLEAHLGRGEGDLLASRDWADIVALVDGREELVEEARDAPAELTGYLGTTLRRLLDEERILDGIRAQLLPDAISQARAGEIVLPRMADIVDGAGRD